MYPNLNLKEKSKKNFGAKIFRKTKSLGLSNNINNKSQKNHRILAKLMKKKKIENWGAPKWA